MLGDVRCAVLLLNGQWDQFRLGERSFLRARPDAEVEHLPGAGHLANLGRPREFADAVLGFVRKVT
jgi:pimeloyl-ACP methyl ester carboxylesterase